MRRKQSIKWIAYEMGITENHAYQTAHRAYRKLGVNNRTDATLAHPRHTRSPNLPCFIRKARVRKAAVA